MRLLKTISMLTMTLALTVAAARGQAQDESLPDAPQPAVTLLSTPKNFLRDQAAIWTSPIRLRTSNAAGPALLVLATTVAITTDHQVLSSEVTHDASINSHFDTASQGLVGLFVAGPALFYGVGHFKHDEHASETGILGGEAIADSLAVDEAAKIISRRERPALDGARGKFFQPGVDFDSSFPSTHSIVAWSSAAVIASEYPGVLTQITAYGLATATSLSRVFAQQHFSSDVLVGSAVGWMIGRYVVRRHRHFDVE
ncbi:MAG TPA: phosphatase PAP2 family protein [Terracidiphilus sp.]|jgi:membrane-associated phospholipid phosphatase|nr:phosphatase PAP2 family protein [Terracidiphilus sp.]